MCWTFGDFNNGPDLVDRSRICTKFAQFCTACLGGHKSFLSSIGEFVILVICSFHVTEGAVNSIRISETEPTIRHSEQHNKHYEWRVKFAGGAMYIVSERILINFCVCIKPN